MMAKKYDVALNTNKKLSELIDQDLQNESKLLQNLINEVVEANQKVKSSHQKRVEETHRRLQQLNDDIQILKNDINKKEKETTLQQLNYLLDSKNRIYEAMQEMRQKNIDVYLQKDSTTNTKPLKESLYTILESHTQAHSDISPFIERFRESIITFVEDSVKKMDQQLHHHLGDEDALKQTVEAFNHQALNEGQFFTEMIKRLQALEETRGHILQSEESDDALSDRIEQTFQERRQEIDNEMQALDEQFEAKKAQLIEQKENIYTTTLDTLKQKYATKLENERETKENLQKDLKTLRLDILQADKEGQDEKLKNLLKVYDNKEKSNLSLYEEKLERKAKKKVKSETKKIDNKLYKLEKNYLEEFYALRLKQEKIRIEKGDSKELFKLREDFKGLSEDLKYNKNLHSTLKETLQQFEAFIEDVDKFKKALNDLYLEREHSFLTMQINTLNQLQSLEKAFKSIQMDLVKHFRTKLFDDHQMRETVQHEIRKHTQEIKKHQKLSRIDKRLIDEENYVLIKQLSDEEDIQSEKIYQNALIELADKEYELQLLKIRSLYDNEIDLTKSQADRLNIGYDVNEAMVSTTLESQILFAKQQIEYATSEYQLRLENIEQSLDKEKEYAEEKLNEHQQKYKTDRIDIIKERDRKLEDLSYKQALFTEEKDKKLLNEQEEKIRQAYAARLQKIDDAETADPYVSRYKKQLENAYNRAEKAKEDAKNIRDKSIATFENMLHSSEEKLAQFKNNKDSADLTPMIESEESTAKNRLNQSIADAKSLYEEKVSDPKKRLAQLDEALSKIHDESDLKEKTNTLLDEKTTIERALEAEKNAIDDKLDQTIASIKEEKETFLTEHERVKETLLQDSSTIQSNHERDIKASINTLKKQFEKQRSTFKTEITEEISRFKKQLDTAFKSLNNTISPAQSAYDKYLKSVTSNTQKRERNVKSNLDKELKSERKALDNLYQK